MVKVQMKDDKDRITATGKGRGTDGYKENPFSHTADWKVIKHVNPVTWNSPKD